MCWCKHCTKHWQCACNEPVDFCASMVTYAASMRPKTPPIKVALLPLSSWHGVYGELPKLQSGHWAQTSKPNRCSMTRRTRTRKPSTLAGGSRAMDWRRSNKFCRWGFTSAVCQPSDLYSNSYTLRSGSYTLSCWRFKTTVLLAFNP